MCLRCNSVLLLAGVYMIKLLLAGVDMVKLILVGVYMVKKICSREGKS